MPSSSYQSLDLEPGKGSTDTLEGTPSRIPYQSLSDQPRQNNRYYNYLTRPMAESFHKFAESWVPNLPTEPAERKKAIEERFSLFGKLVTFSSVIPQGLFAGLLADMFYQWLTKDSSDVKNNEELFGIIRIVSDGIFCFSAIAGKYAFITSCNDYDFRSLAYLEFSRMFQKQDENGAWQPLSRVELLKKVSSLTFGATGSAIFGALCILGMQATADLAREYETDFCDFLVDLSSFELLQGFTALSSVISNTLFFSFANTAFEKELNIVKHLLALMVDSSYREDYQQYLNKVSQFNLAIKPLVESIDHLIQAINKPKESQNEYTQNQYFGDALAAIKKLLIIDPTFNETTAKEALKHYLITNKAKLKTPSEILLSSMGFKIPSLYRDIFASGLTVGAAGVCMAGYINFYTIADEVTKPYIGDASKAFAGMVMVEMLAIACIATLDFQSILAGFLEPSLKTPQPLLSSTLKVLTLLICLLGAMPNAYQSLALAKEAVGFVVVAFIASALSELIGTRRMLDKSQEKSVKAKLLEKGEREILGLFEVYDNILQEKPKQPPLPDVISERTKNNVNNVFSAPSTLFCCPKNRRGMTRVATSEVSMGGYVAPQVVMKHGQPNEVENPLRQQR